MFSYTSLLLCSLIIILKVLFLHPYNLHCCYIFYLLFINYIFLLLYAYLYIVLQHIINTNCSSITS